MSYEESIIFHGAPTILGIKPANLINLTDSKELRSLIKKINTTKNETKIKILRNDDSKILLFLYNERLLDENLKRRQVKKLLSSFGYSGDDIKSNLKMLQLRFQKDYNFPHEIGLFLGYPHADVVGFINKKPCKFVGYWKVYTNVYKAVKTFALYDRARDSLIEAFHNKNYSLV